MTPSVGDKRTADGAAVFDDSRVVIKINDGGACECTKCGPRGPCNLFTDLVNAQRVAIEIALLRNITSPYVVRCLSALPYHEDDGAVSCVLEAYDTTLQHMLDSDTGNRFDTIHHVQYVMYQVILGLHELHRRGVAHYDVSASNILLTSRCRAALCDLGLASYAAKASECRSIVWNRAPEVVIASRRGGVYDYKADIFAAGCVLASALQLQRRAAAHHAGAPVVAGSRRPLFSDGVEGMRTSELLLIQFEVTGVPSEVDLAALGNLKPDERQAFTRLVTDAPMDVRDELRTGQLDELLEGAPACAIALVRAMLQTNPAKRPDCATILAHEFFAIHAQWELPPLAEPAESLTGALDAVYAAGLSNTRLRQLFKMLTS
jgi:serine/threonine protein kinase